MILFSASPRPIMQKAQPVMQKALISYRFCSVSELRQAGSITRWVDELKDEITALYCKNEIKVWSSICPHYGGDFHVDCKTGEMRCKWHDWRFSTESGELKNRKLKLKLRSYDFAEEDGYLVISSK